MTIDERIEKLTESQEKTQVMLVQIVESIQRLERIAVAHSLDIDDVQFVEWRKAAANGDSLLRADWVKNTGSSPATLQIPCVR